MLLKRIPQSALILLAMFIGIAAGHLIGHVYTVVEAIADGFVMLLQMTALPYITLSLIVGIGGLTPANAKATTKLALLVVLAMTAICMVYIFLAPIAFPNWTNADFYSAHTIKVAEEFRLIDLFIPANPFGAYANAVIPSVVLFSIFIGIGLMTVPDKKRALAVMSSFQQSVGNVSGHVMKLAPLGVFCIGYRAAATINPTDIDGLLVYVLTAASLTLLLSFIVLPAIVAIITPFSYRQIIRVSRQAMVTAFATGSFFIVIPTIVEKARTLINELTERKDIEKMPGILVPITFSLPVGGKLLALLFTLFAAWFSGAHITSADYMNLISTGLPQLFGTSTIAVPHLLDIFNVSSAMFDFFILSENLAVGRLGALLSVMFATCIPLLLAAAMTKSIKLHKRKLLVNMVVIPVLSVLVFLLLRFTFSSISYQYQGYDKFIDRDFLFTTTASNYLSAPEEQMATTYPFTNVLSRIEQRGFIRVGYFRDDLPYSFHNKDGKLVGFDIEIFNQLAADLDVDIEYVRIFHDQAAPLLSSGYLDITSGIPVIPDNLKEYTMTVPYSVQEVAFIVRDNRRAEFTQWTSIVNREDLIVGVPETFFYKDAIRKTFTKGKAWEISTPRLFFRPEYEHIDGMLFGAAAASGWTLLYPNYTVVAPKPQLPALSMAFPINKDDDAFELYMRNWIEMKKQSGFIDQVFEYWIEGKTPKLVRALENEQ